MMTTARKTIVDGPALGMSVDARAVASSVTASSTTPATRYAASCGSDGVPNVGDTVGSVAPAAPRGGADERKGSSANDLLPWRCAGQPPVEGQQAPRRRRVCLRHEICAD